MFETNHPKEKVDRPRRRRRAPPGFLTVSQVAELSEFAPSTVYRHVDLGSIRASKWRGLTVIAERDAKEFMAVRPMPTAEADSVGTGARDD